MTKNEQDKIERALKAPHINRGPVHPSDRLLVIKALAKKYNKPESRPAGWDRMKRRYELHANYFNNSEHLGDFQNFTQAKQHLNNLDPGPLDGADLILTDRSTKKKWAFLDNRWVRA